MKFNFKNILRILLVLSCTSAWSMNSGPGGIPRPRRNAPSHVGVPHIPGQQPVFVLGPPIFQPRPLTKKMKIALGGIATAGAIALYYNRSYIIPGICYQSLDCISPACWLFPNVDPKNVGIAQSVGLSALTVALYKNIDNHPELTDPTIRCGLMAAGSAIAVGLLHFK